MTRPTRALIDLDAWRYNLERVRTAAAGRKVVAIVKADAYGHGLEYVPTALESADAFGVASLEEAISLRDAGIKCPVVLLEGFFASDELDDVSRYGLDVVIHHNEQVEQLERFPLSHPIGIWLKIDSGMHRLGFPPGEARKVYRRLRENSTRVSNIRLMTHLACADDRSDPRTHAQLEKFHRSCAGVETETSISNSAGILGWPEAHGDWVRPGIMLYGVSPFIGTTAQDDDLRPVMTLQTRLIAVNRCGRGEGVGYGATWSCPEEMRVGVAAIGYGDGYPRHAPTETPVLVNGRRVPLIGRVSMDMITLDLRGLPEAKPGDPVVLWGQGLPVEEIAAKSGTIAYELLCGITGRVPKIVVSSKL
ncbi:MAG: alanine racemase [Gammaproteobacteria bacterium]|nr:alanine racemase [Gammaproteobacteria bacterium]